MIQLRICLAIAIALTTLWSCTNGSVPDEGEIVATNTEGGDSTETLLQLNFQDLELADRYYLVFRQELPFAEMNGFLALEGKRLANEVLDAGVEPLGPLSSLFYAWDTEAGMGDAAVAIQVAENTELPPYVTVKIPATRALALDLDGSYQRLSAFHVGLGEELKRRGLRPVTPSIEEYYVGPLQTRDPNEFRTKIIYPYAQPDTATE